MPQFPAAPAPPQVVTNSPSRYLFAVDTSAAMRPYAPAVAKAISNLLASSLHGQLQPGDSIGMWMYDENLHAGRFPLQSWTPETTVLVASSLVAFLRAQPYAGASRLDRVWPTLTQVIGQSERLTVLLVSDGDERVAGTPYDREINAFFRQQFTQQQKARQPFITVLRTQRGAFVGCSLNCAPWPVEFPEFPPLPPIIVPPAPRPQPPPASKQATSPTPPPTIVIERKTEGAPLVATTNGVVAVTSAPVVATPQVPKTAIEVAPAAPTNAPGASALSVAEPLAAPQPPPAAIPAVKAEPAVMPPAKPVEPPAATPSADMNPPPRAEPAVATVPVVAPQPQRAWPGPDVLSNRFEETGLKVSTPPPAAVGSTSPALAQVATATPQTTGWPLGTVAIAGGGLLLAGAVAVLLLQRHSRAASHASLITRSMDKGGEDS